MFLFLQLYSVSAKVIVAKDLSMQFLNSYVGIGTWSGGRVVSVSDSMGTQKEFSKGIQRNFIVMAKEL